MNDPVHIVCPACAAVNRIPRPKLTAAPKCGRCKAALFTGKPTELGASTFQTFTERNDIPVVIDCWAPWCGPCLAMAPAFEQAAQELEPNVRLAKLNTEDAQALGASLGIRSIPTLIFFNAGKEVARQAGALSAADIVRWVKTHM